MKKNTWEGDSEEKWIFDQKEKSSHPDNTIQYIKYFTAFFVIFSGLMYFIATKFF